MGKSNIDAIRQEMAAARQKFANSVEGLVAQNDPKVLKDRVIQSVKSFVQGELDHAMSYVRNEDGTWKTDVLVKGALVVVGSVVAMAGLRRLVRGPKKVVEIVSAID